MNRKTRALWIGMALLLSCGSALAQADSAAEQAGTPGTSTKTVLDNRQCGTDPVPNVDWSGCKMNWIDLSGADLRGANLAGASLLNSNLSGANLAGANLAGALLGGANLQGTDLTDADLRTATLVKSKLTGVILDRTRFDGAIYANAKRCGPDSIGFCR